MDELGFRREAVRFIEALKARGVSAADFTALCDNSLALDYAAHWLKNGVISPEALRAREARIQEAYDARCPKLDRTKLLARTYTQLRYVKDICWLQVLSEKDLLDYMRNIGGVSVDDIKKYLHNYGGLRLRYESEPRGARVKEIFGDARILPLHYLATTSVLTVEELRGFEELGVRRLGDFLRFRADVLRHLKNSIGRPIFTERTLNLVSKELKQYNLGFATE